MESNNKNSPGILNLSQERKSIDKNKKEKPHVTWDEE